MIGKLIKAVFGSKNERELKRMNKTVARISALEPEIQALSDEQLKAKTLEFRERYNKGETLDQLLPEAFATVREASKRVLGMRHFDVQMIGGMSLHEGRIAEMRTGEGKTLVSTLPSYLHALAGKGVHIVTVNDYLASRDANWMMPLYEFLGMTVGVIQSMQPASVKRAAYAADVTYGTNNEYGFDYLRDNMALSKRDKVQRPLNFAVIDEVDSILIDEARTPLIISGAAENSSELYKRMNQLVLKLKRQIDNGEDGDRRVISEPGDFTVDEKSRQVELTEDGHQRVEDLLIQAGLLQPDQNLYAANNLALLHHVNSALRAHALFHLDVEYIVQEGQVVLIDEHTGRTMPGRRLSEGLHQAIEAKEGVAIQSESQTLASTTFQNYFRLYPTLSGMTGTADTEAYEFREIYGLDVVVIPTNRVVQRLDMNDKVFLSLEEKYLAIVEDIKAFQSKNAPILVGTASIETSEEMSRRLTKAGIKHQVLNAKFHAQEAEIIAQAGRPGAVTIATNMAGRGTDIVLGGRWESDVAKVENPTPEQIEAIKADWKQRHETVLAAGGLHIIGTERHESRRIDNQLRGRAGRQGDPGLTRFYLSLEDNLMRIFASERVRNFMQALGMEKGEAIEHRMVNNAIEKAQRKVEGRNFDIRKQLLEFDDVANDQRQIIYHQRNELLDADSIRETITAIREEVVEDLINGFIPPQSIEDQWDVAGLEKQIETDFGLRLTIAKWLEEDTRLHEETLRKKILAEIQGAYDTKCERVGDIMLEIEKQVMLQVLDNAWKDHLATMDHLRQGINLRSYAQRNPKQEYKREAFELFQSLLMTVKRETIHLMARVEPISREQMEEMENQRREELARQKMQLRHDELSALGEAEPEPVASAPRTPSTVVREGRKVGRNDPCPCGSGKKFKSCHGALE
ncbi:preprotein translocase subunit SecA [Cellvibrio mixtus]|uniref:Protein translocase subunit SecA n=1 Tax=Cellvibrio mixtus TaxID=39650 RepID=A0A266Q219_9GAMM|nr:MULTISPECIES: preprotein translocase subunit SecA [Cellvibrio]AQT60482.1 preprotein translocase subunit SecA [Cellvibrio sp. PSBB023]OZY83917.1 preprotein translocase subunit SecA [Cellvibrio mixtus]